MTDLAEIWVPEPQNNSKNNGTNFTGVIWVKFQLSDVLSNFFGFVLFFLNVIFGAAKVFGLFNKIFAKKRIYINKELIVTPTNEIFSITQKNVL